MSTTENSTGVSSLPFDSDIQTDLVEKLDQFLSIYCRESLGTLAEHYPTEQRILEVSYGDLAQFDEEIADDFVHSPQFVLDHLTVAVRQFELPALIDLTDAEARVTDLPSNYQFTVGQFNPDDVTGRLIGIRGQVSKRTPRQILVKEAVFECHRCGAFTQLKQEDPKHRIEPHQCSGCERQGPFKFKLHESDTVQYQEIRLQTPPEEAATASTETIDIRLTGELVDAVNPGERIIANVWADADWKTEDSALLDLFGNAHSIEPLEHSIDELDTSEYRDEIDELKQADNTIERIINSIAPSHMGDREIKEAIAYQLVSGVNGKLPDGSLKRGTIHLLLCGDPGCGKSKLLSYVTRIAPRSLKTTGKGSTGVGLTFAAVQDDFGDQGRSLEAGALVEAHRGICAIDELDKMQPEDQDGALECMSDQEVSRSVWGMNVTLPAQTSILAAENPRDGRFNLAEPFAQQIGLAPEFINRFDLIFTITDQPDREADRAMAQHLAKTSRVGQLMAAGKQVTDSDVLPEIEPDVLCAYVAEVRNLYPVLTDDAASIIEEEYVELRQANDENGPVPTNARDPLALTRLAEAAARIDYSETIEPRHIERVIAVRRACLNDIGIDPETGNLDVDVVETGQSKAQRERVRSIKSIIKDLQEEYTDGAPLAEVLDIATDMGIDETKAKDQIKSLRDKGELYAPEKNILRVV